ncbi:MAG: mechanosensitive ion channel [Pseudomonadota bacterium]
MLVLVDMDIAPLGILIDEAEALASGMIALLPNLIAALVVLLITWALAFLVRNGMRKALSASRMRPSLQSALQTLVNIAVWAGGLLVAMTVLLPGLTPARLLAGLGIGSLAVGLAFKDVFENFLAGLLILLRKPMRIGDDIECGDVEGRVEEITIRDTYLRRRDGVLIIVPNATIYNTPVKILTHEPFRRVELVVGVAYGEDVDHARDVILGAMRGLSTVHDGEPVHVLAREFNSSSVDFQVLWWCASAPIEEEKSRDEVTAAIKRALDNAGIEIPFPYRTLTFKEPLTVTRLPDPS